MFRFTIRDVLWLTTLIAVVLGGGLLLGRTAGQRSELVLIIQEQQERILELETNEAIRTAAAKKASPAENN
jgi:hypothetical protein